MTRSTATRKFEKSHLKDVLKRRKEVAKIKQRQKVKPKRKDPRPENGERNGDSNDVSQQKTRKFQTLDQDALSGIDDLFQTDFTSFADTRTKVEVHAQRQERVAPGNKRKRLDAETQPDDISAESSPDHPQSGQQSTSEADEDESYGVGHREQLDALAEKDPEFYSYLQENDAELLYFAEDLGPDQIDTSTENKAEIVRNADGRADESDDRANGAGNQRAARISIEVTTAMVRKWETAMTGQHSLRSTKEVVQAFRAATLSDEEDGKNTKYSIADSSAYHELLVLAVTHIPTVLGYHLPVKETAAGKIRVPTDSKKYKTLAPLIKSHLVSLQRLLENLSDEATLRLTLSRLEHILPYCLSFRKLVRDTARTIVAIWSEHSNTEATRIAAFLSLRRLVVTGDPSIREVILKTTYQGLIRGSRNTTVHTLQGVNLMKNSAAELWGIDANVAYTTGFTFIRQLAVHLRTSIIKKSKESFKMVYNWQYIHSLDFWSRVLSAHCDEQREAQLGKESALRPLIYPIVQITLGTMRLIPTAQYFPLRFHLVRSVVRLALATGTYVPLATSLLEALNSGEMKKPPRASMLKGLDFSCLIRAPKSHLRTRVYQDGVGEQIIELFSEICLQWTKNIAFPELALPIIVLLKRWLKEVSNRSTGNKNGKINSSIALLVQKLEANSRWIGERRAKVDFAPNDRAGVLGFVKDIEWQKTPLGAYVVGQRKIRYEKARASEEGRRENERKAKSEDQPGQKRRLADTGLEGERTATDDMHDDSLH